MIPLPATVGTSIPEAARRRLSSPGATVIVVLITVVWTIPTVGLFVTSLRPEYLTKSSGWWTALADRTFTLGNYEEVLSGGDVIPGGITPYLFNTVAIAIPATVIPILIASMVAYALAWIPFRGAAVPGMHDDEGGVGRQTRAERRDAGEHPVLVGWQVAQHPGQRRFVEVLDARGGDAGTRGDGHAVDADRRGSPGVGGDVLDERRRPCLGVERRHGARPDRALVEPVGQRGVHVHPARLLD
ncbi:MAG: alpha-glucoside transport system permease protein, partial [Actinomycetota bacterium]|nr:alpha-glucoside transport system permease protein [Actinomycetota bacterium]